jgi:hypothetical protein
MEVCMRRLVSVAIAALSLGVLLLAQPSVTMTLKSGETLNAQLVDLGGVGFTLRVGGSERRVAQDDVTLIDFDGTGMAQPSEVDSLGGRHLLVLRNGTVVRGELIDIGGVQPLRLTFRTDAGQRDYSSNEVRRIYLSKPPAAPTSAAPAPAPTPTPLPAPVPGGQSFRVSATLRWTTTSITVRRGQRIQFSATGQVDLAAGGAVRCGPDGSANRDPGAPVPGIGTGTLIGRVDPGRQRIAANPFVIGAGATLAMPNDGVLTLGVNDGNLGDNGGAFDVRVVLVDPARRLP